MQYKTRYTMLYMSQRQRGQTRRNIADLQANFIDKQQSIVSTEIEQGKNKKRKPVVDLEETTMVMDLSSCVDTREVSESNSRKSSASVCSSSLLLQPSIDASIQNLHQGGICYSNNHKLESAMADFFHCENVPD